MLGSRWLAHLPLLPFLFQYAQSECKAAEKELDTARQKMVELEISSGVMKEERDRLRAEVRTFSFVKHYIHVCARVCGSVEFIGL